MIEKEINVLLILTGGTIGTCVSEDGKRRIAPENGAADPLLFQIVRKERPDLQFTVNVKVPYQVLSEHMTLDHLNRLGDCLRESDIMDYDGVMITHGSDTLAYTAAFLGELLQGCPVPVFLLASQRPPEDPESNALANTLTALEMIRSGWYMQREPEETERFSVYVPYRNSDGVMYLHRASELRQCEPGTDDFFSEGMRPVPMGFGEFSDRSENAGSMFREADGTISGERAAKETVTEETEKEETKTKETKTKETKTKETETEEAEKEEAAEGETVAEDSETWQVPAVHLIPDVLLIRPYVGIRYDCISLSGIRAVLHTLYHSSTAPKELSGFLERCRKEGVSCYILPCDAEAYHYETTTELLRGGAIPLTGMTEERAYIRLLMG